ncbi:MAG: hypothetical protein LBF27_19890 [Sphingobacterium sp.]|jgi:hypothetical protein|nr:hypothetical protein [Sphingobacterium sp.]
MKNLPTSHFFLMKRISTFGQEIKNNMIRYILIIVTLYIPTACHRSYEEDLPLPNYRPKMKIKDFGDVSVTFPETFPCDIDGDGLKDLFFKTELIGDPINRCDYHSFSFRDGSFTCSPVNSEEETPSLTAGDIIGKYSFPNHSWHFASTIVLAKKNIPLSGSSFWSGPWKDSAHKYLPFAIEKHGERYYGWLELSFSKSEECIILHRAAVAEVAGKNVFAGQ